MVLLLSFLSFLFFVFVVVFKRRIRRQANPAQPLFVVGSSLVKTT